MITPYPLVCLCRNAPLPLQLLIIRLDNGLNCPPQIPENIHLAPRIRHVCHDPQQLHLAHRLLIPSHQLIEPPQSISIALTLVLRETQELGLLLGFHWGGFLGLKGGRETSSTLVEEFRKVDEVEVSLDAVARRGAVIVFHAAEGREVAVGGCRVVFLLGGREGVVSAAVTDEAEQEFVSIGGLDVQSCHVRHSPFLTGAMIATIGK
jgi:hypothetical protein